jgi:hypothetical protein
MKSVPGLRSLVVPSTRGLRFRIQSLWFRSRITLKLSQNCHKTAPETQRSINPNKTKKIDEKAQRIKWLFQWLF